MASLKKQIKEAPKYVLYIEGAGYLADNQNLTGIIFTDDVKYARLYAVGFDNPEIKLGIWNAEAKKLFNTEEVKFELIYL
jgi:hypothetical protein